MLPTHIKDLIISIPSQYILTGVLCMLSTYLVNLFVIVSFSPFLYSICYFYPIIIISLGVFGFVTQINYKKIVHYTSDISIKNGFAHFKNYTKYFTNELFYHTLFLIFYFCIDEKTTLIYAVFFLLLLSSSIVITSTFKKRMKPIFDKNIIKLTRIINKAVLDNENSVYFIMHSWSTYVFDEVLNTNDLDNISNINLKKIFQSKLFLLIYNDQFDVKKNIIHFKDFNIKVPFSGVLDYCITNDLKINDLSREDLSLIKMIAA